MERKEGMKKNREMFSGLMAWLVSACFFLGCFGKQPYFDLWSYTDSVLPGVSGSYGCYRKNAGETKLF